MNLDNEKIEDKMVNHMNDKYDDEFHFVSYFGGTFLGKGDVKEIICNSKKYPDAAIWVSYNRETEVYSDDYITVKYLEKINDLAKTIADKVLPNEEYYIDEINNDLHSPPKDASDSTTFEELISQPEAGLTLEIYVNTNRKEYDLDEIKNKLEQEIKKSKICFVKGDIYFIDDYSEDIHKDVIKKNNIITNDEYKHHLFFMMDNSGFKEIYWEK